LCQANLGLHWCNPVLHWPRPSFHWAKLMQYQLSQYKSAGGAFESTIASQTAGATSLGANVVPGGCCAGSQPGQHNIAANLRRWDVWQCYIARAPFPIGPWQCNICRGQCNITRKLCRMLVPM
jgi:hypothetical protein